MRVNGYCYLQVGDFPDQTYICGGGTTAISVSDNTLSLRCLNIGATNITYFKPECFHYTGSILDRKYDNNDSITAQKYKITCGINFN